MPNINKDNNDVYHLAYYKHGLSITSEQFKFICKKVSEILKKNGDYQNQDDYINDEITKLKKALAKSKTKMYQL